MSYDRAEQVKQFGFANVDHIASSVRAGRFFKENPELLQQYAITLAGINPTDEANYWGDSQWVHHQAMEQNDNGIHADYSVYPDHGVQAFGNFHVDQHKHQYSVVPDFEFLLNHLLENAAADKKLFEHDYSMYQPLSPEVNNGTAQPLALPKSPSELRVLLLGLDEDESGPFMKLMAKIGVTNVTTRHDDNPMCDNVYRTAKYNGF